jgi:hypothetical protein
MKLWTLPVEPPRLPKPGVGGCALGGSGSSSIGSGLPWPAPLVAAPPEDEWPPLPLKYDSERLAAEVPLRSEGGGGGRMPAAKAATSDAGLLAASELMI